MTTDNDRVVASVLVMATCRAYFGYEFVLSCGLPGVTLEGERGDWVRLLEKIERLLSFEDENLTV